jgi:hypothetical protein
MSAIALLRYSFVALLRYRNMARCPPHSPSHGPCLTHAPILQVKVHLAKNPAKYAATLQPPLRPLACKHSWVDWAYHQKLSRRQFTPAKCAKTDRYSLCQPRGQGAHQRANTGRGGAAAMPVSARSTACPAPTIGIQFAAWLQPPVDPYGRPVSTGSQGLRQRPESHSRGMTVNGPGASMTANSGYQHVHPLGLSA